VRRLHFLGVVGLGLGGIVCMCGFVLDRAFCVLISLGYVPRDAGMGVVILLYMCSRILKAVITD
jgi:hypothetical protein